YSFPSGHTSTSTAMAYVLSCEYKRWILMSIPVIVGFSRLYIGVHYPSDVLGGFLLGLVIAYMAEYFF
ncbi:MAG: phosphatase PAP2 family protein, partial [Methanosphaera sp.]|nr:phosphatase PAP2 family protein [Methanosphaera sp.]